MNANFQSFFSALFTLFRISTGENWNFLMADLARTRQPNFACREFEFHYYNYQKYGITGCGLPIGATLYFLSFQLLFTMIMLNLFIAVILKVFDDDVSQADKPSLDKQDFELLKEVWIKYDGEGSGLIKAKDFESFLLDLEPPLGWEENSLPNAHQLLEFIKGLSLAAYYPEKSQKERHDDRGEYWHSSLYHELHRAEDKAYYYFHEVILSLSRKIYEKKTSLM